MVEERSGELTYEGCVGLTAGKEGSSMPPSGLGLMSWETP